MPNPLVSPVGRQARDLEEVKFWLEIMREHALFIKNGLSVTHADLISEADDYYRRFGELLALANRVNGEKKYRELINDSLALVRKFYRFNRRLLRMALTGKLYGSLFPLMLDHFSREALYAIHLLERVCDGKQAFYKASMIREMLFWLRIMADHAKLISHLLDPSETGLIETAEDFAGEFDALYLQARDFASMLGAQSDIPAFDRFILDVRAAVIRFRDFNRALFTMIQEGRVIGLIPPLLADHYRDEADHFLIILAMMEKGLIECVVDESAVDLMHEEIVVDEDVAVAQDVPVIAHSPVPQYNVAETVNDYDDDEEWDDERQPEAVKETVVEEEEQDCGEAEEEDEPEPPKPAMNPKFKWSGKWPRPLGRVSE